MTTFPLTTQALVNAEPGSDFELADVEIPELRDDEVLVRIEAAGLCHTDISVRDSLPAEMFPRVFGHEGAGVVEAVGDAVEGLTVGDCVVLSFRACRNCANCTTLGVGYCENSMMFNYMGLRPDGSTTLTRDGAPIFASFFGQSSFARHAVAYADNVVKVESGSDLSRLGPFGCAFQTGGGSVLNVLQPGANDSLVVYGVGAVGLAAIAAATEVGTVIAVDLKPERLQAAAALGAQTVNPTDTDASVVDRVKELTGGGSSHALDTTGVASLVKDAAAALRPRGQLVVLGLGDPELAFDAVDVMMNGKVVRGSIEGDSDPQAMIPMLLSRAADGDFQVDHLISTYPFTDINTAAADLLSGKAIKPVLVWE